MIYIVVGLIIILFAYLEAFDRSKKNSRIVFPVLCFVLVFFAGLRYGVGTDWLAYYNFYLETTDRVEIGYAFLNNTFSEFSIHYNIFLLFTNSISIFLIAKFIRNQSPFYILGLRMFYSNLFLYYNFSGMRQALAISITCFRYSYALDKKFIKFLLLVVLASTFHASASVFILIYFLPREKISFLYGIFVLSGFFVFYQFLNLISDFITLYTANNANYYINVIEKSDSLLTLFLIGITVRLVILIVVFAFRKKVFAIKNFRYIFNIYLFGLLIYLSTYMISPDIGVRVSSYFLIFDIIIAGNIIGVVYKATNRVLIVTVFSLLALYRLIGYSKSEGYNYFSIIENAL